MSQDKQSTSIKKILINALNEEKVSLADEYIKMNEVLKFVYWYFAFNIDEVAGEKIDKLTLSQLSAVLEPKINLYKNYVRTDAGGEFIQRNNPTMNTD